MFYTEPAIRERLVEFLGGPSLEEATALYFTTRSPASGFEPLPVNRLWDALDQEPELNRSLWDRESVMAHLEIDHVNFDDPWQPLRDPVRSLEVQAGLVDCVLALLGRFGIRPLHLLSGRGHHFVWRIPLEHPAALHLARLSPLPEGLPEMYAAPHRPTGEAVDPRAGAAFAGLGLLMEWIAQEALQRARGLCPLPVQLTAVESPPHGLGREVLSLDLSEYGDPLHKRTVRMPFSLYHKGGACLVMVPVTGADAPRTPRAAVELAATSCARIPDAGDATLNLLAAYRASSLAGFHRWYYDHAQTPPAGESLRDLPPCLRLPLEYPNDLLLKPAVLQHLVRSLVARHWHPRQVAGLVRGLLEQDHGWLNDLHFYHAGLRADFYVRTFAGLLASRLDNLADFNCESHRSKGYCDGSCGQSLEPMRRALLGGYVERESGK